MKFDVLEVVDLNKDNIYGRDKSCDMCGSKIRLRLAITSYETKSSPQEDEIMCEKCLKREGWNKEEVSQCL